MAYLSYTEQLLDQRWQERRKHILQRDNFTCQWCGSTDKTLHIHHFTYETGAMAWDAPEDDLITICCDCHYLTHNKSFSDIVKRLYNLIKGMAQTKSPLSQLSLREANKIILKYKK